MSDTARRQSSVATAVVIFAFLLASCSTTTVIDRSQTTDTTATEVPSTVEDPAPPAPTVDTESPEASAQLSQADFEFVVDTSIADATLGKEGGAIVFARRADKSYETAIGWADNQGYFLETDTPMRIGSISKPLIATMILQMVDEGSIDLDAPLKNYLPATTHGADTSIRAILGHRSGLLNYTADMGFIDDIHDDPERVWSPQEVLDTVDSATISAGVFSYSNTNYILAGQLIEAIDGQPLHAALDARINSLAGTNFVLPGPDVDAPATTASVFAGGLYGGEQSINFSSVESAAWAAGAVIGTASDLARFADALAGGELMSEAAFTEMRPVGLELNAPGSTTVFEQGLNPTYGLGLMAIPMGPSTIGIGHNGAIDGFASVLALDLATGDMVIVLTNDMQIANNDIALDIVTGW